MQFQLLFTVFAVLASCIATWMAYSAREWSRRAEHAEHRLAIMRGQVRGLEVSLVALDEAHRKLAGKVHADAYWRGKRDEQPELQPDEQPRAEMGELCVNWSMAQREGPGSPAAGCECAYCNARRADRAARRAKLRSGVKS
jgi:hypothetical protein